MRAACVLLLATAAGGAPAIEPPREWLVIRAIDARGRQPFNPDRVFARYLLDRDAPTPEEGEAFGGATWTKVLPDDKGAVGGDIAYAYARLESDKDRLALARVPGGATLWVNGDAFAGDVYGMGTPGVPVRLRKGPNHLFVRGIRGSFRLELEEVEPGIVVSPRDATVPDLGPGRQGVGGAVTAVSTLDRTVAVAGNAGPTGRMPAVLIGPLGVRRVPFGVGMHRREDGDRTVLTVSVGDAVVSGRTELTLRHHEEGEARRITFGSSLDGSVQEYSVLPPAGDPAGAGIVLTLHGAGVDAFGQACAYSAKEGLWIVAPTNRRPFGFDWQDWGRLDAYEVLAHALAWTKADPARVYVTGHSMGGHGTWHLAANDPDRFLAIAPSAGWCSFDTYGGRPAGALAGLWRGADGASLTLDLVENLAPVPTFILHGEADDNVPASEARRMEKALREAGGDPEVHLQPGAGHWWDGEAAKGTDCVDWPPIFDLFRRTAPRPAPDALTFVTADPGIDAGHHWVTVLQPREYGRPARVRARRSGVTVEVDTENVRRLALGAPASLVVLDGQPLLDPVGLPLRGHAEGDPRVFGPSFLRSGDRWTVAEPAAAEKSPERCGPFKRAFANRFVFVHGKDDSEGLARARYEQQVWWYRANGDVETVDDGRFLEHGYAGRNVILFGNASSNRAFAKVLPAGCPIRVLEGAIRAGGRSWGGDDLGCVFVYPRDGEERALVGVFGATGARGARLGYALLPFVSGVGYPDYAVFGPGVLAEGDGGVLAAGWFDHAWALGE